MKPTSALLLGLFSLTFTNVLTAQNVPSAKDICMVPGDPDKSQYHLFNPTPTDLMRELSTDRPDKTESPYTVDAGHLQIEVDLVSWTRDRSDGAKTDAFNFSTTNFKLGITDSLDFQVVVESYHYERTRSGGARTTDQGFGDLTLRTKYNLWGNESGRTAFALMPFVTLPTARGNFGAPRAEAGLILPLAIELTSKLGMGLMTEIDWVNDDDGGHTFNVINSVTFGYSLTEDLGMYVEFFSEIPTENSSAWIGTADVGFTYGLTDNVQLDIGAAFGVTDAADDVNVFTGFTVRF